MKSLKELLTNSFWYCPNRDKRVEEVLKKIEKELMYQIYDDSDSIVKIKDAMPLDDALVYLKQKVKKIIYG